jgi:hypothetical protein
MEFLKVIVPGKEGQDIDALVDGEINGKVGEVITLGVGFVMISVDLPDAEEKEIDLCDTTPVQPKVVEIQA